MTTIASQITSLTVIYSTVYSDADQRKHQSSASLAFVRGIHRRQVNSPHKWPVTRKMFPFDDVIKYLYASATISKRNRFTRCFHLGIICKFLHHESMRQNTLRPTQNGCRFADYIFKCIFLNENF